jgi:crotonobetainyl-CoA:carnitine CoA-transferase CaiB-like acyl-CoA transferase
MTGITTAVAILSSLVGVLKGSRGHDIDVSLFDVALHQLTYPGAWYLNSGYRTERLPRSAHPSTVPVQLQRTSDGWIFIMCMTQKFWSELVRTLERPDLGTHPAYATTEARRAHRDALTAVLDAVFSTATTAEWLVKLQGVLPAAPVYDLPQALENPYLRTIGMVKELSHPAQDGYRVLANPIKLDGERLPSQRAPRLGEHTDAVLRELGYDAATIVRLRATGAT